MTAQIRYASFSDSTWTRDQVINLLNTALLAGERKYTRQVAISWLSAFPGDLQVRLINARSLLMEESKSYKEQALQILSEVCQYDPEFIEAQKYLALVEQELNTETAGTTANCVVALGGTSLRVPHGPGQHPDWALQLRETRRLLLASQKSFQSKSKNNGERVETLIHQVLIANPNTPLTAVTHLRVLDKLGTISDLTINRLAKVYLDRWPNCLPILLFYAQSMMEDGDASLAVSLLHRAVSMDIAGQVPRRLWGENHIYQSLWPENLSIDPGCPNSPQNSPIPAGIATIYGWNQLPPYIHAEESIPEIPRQGSSSSHNPDATVSESTSDEIRILSKSALNANRDGRFPIYVVFTTRMGLKQHYGAENLPIIEEALHRLVMSIRGRRINQQNWGAMLFFADDPNTATILGINPARHNDPWSLKLVINDLDTALGKRGERIGALVIIGGHEVVPFHHLPNPVDDIDKDVPSDNPYGTRDENYFILEWPVGRLPGGSDSDPGNLVRLINTICDQHLEASIVKPWYHIWYTSILNKITPKRKRSTASLGYSAAVWRRASLSVFRLIGDPRSLRVSPPFQACDPGFFSRNHLSKKPRKSDAPTDTPSCMVLPPAQLGYFNLHGLSDACEWYGQRDPTDPSEGVDFPIALRPQDIHNSGQAPRVVFSEACYGAYIHGKRAEEAISIKFLTSGTLAVVGSTSTCYGSISSPLIAADLLGRVYWGLIAEGYLAGEALRRAKLYLAKEMHQRQGFLDGEDQKTLVSFVLYGDPLAQPYPSSKFHKQIKAIPDVPRQLLTVSDHQATMNESGSPSSEVFAQVKQVVNQYLPGMSDAQFTLSKTSILQSTNAKSQSPTTNRGKNNTDLHGRQVVILSKNIEQANLIHPQLARLTLDRTGKLIKLTVSR